MVQHCSLCAKPMEAEGDICDSCQERIRAEAMGRGRKAVQTVRKELESLDMRKRTGTKVSKDPPLPHGGEEGKKPHHFKNMAEYLEYLKEKKEKMK